MSNQNCMELFNKYLVDVKHASENTLSSYMRDIRQLSSYLDTHGDSTLDTATNKEIGEYVNWLKAAGKSVATVSRNIASMKCFYSYMVDNNLIEKNPAISIIPVYCSSAPCAHNRTSVSPTCSKHSARRRKLSVLTSKRSLTSPSVLRKMRKPEV